MSHSLGKWVEAYDKRITTLQWAVVPLLFMVFSVCGLHGSFFRSGLIKIASWDSTLYLFEFEYQVPILQWELAAYLGTAAELILPTFLVLGLVTRPMAIILFMFNIMAVVFLSLIMGKRFFRSSIMGINDPRDNSLGPWLFIAR